LAKSASALATVGLLCAALIAGHHSTAHAQIYTPNDVKEIKPIPGPSPEEFAKLTTEYTENPPGDKFLAFSLRLPKGWRRVGDILTTGDASDKLDSKSVLTRRVLGKIARYYGPASIEATSRFEVNALELDFGISARNWFLNYITANGFTLQGLTQINDKRIEALYVLVDEDVTYIVRTVAQINGPRMVMASYYLPDNLWQEERPMQERVIKSFHFLNPENVPSEISRTYSFLNFLKFDYPASWKLVSPDITNTEGLDVRLLNKGIDNTLNGEIIVHIVSTETDTTLSQEVASVKANLENQGFSTGDLIEVQDNYKFNKNMTFGRVETYKVASSNKKIGEHEYWMCILTEDRYYYVVTMLTLSRTAEFYTWARNTEAFKSVVQSIRPYNE